MNDDEKTLEEYGERWPAQLRLILFPPLPFFPPRPLCGSPLPRCGSTVTPFPCSPAGFAARL